jgi:DNA-binding NarL/FixJ family response regulator
MTRLDRIVELATRLGVARAEVTRLEAELEAMLGGGEAAEGPPPPVKNGHSKGKRGRPHDPIREKVVELAKEGLAPTVIATKLGIDRKAVSNHVFRARKAGTLPKVGARQ